MKKNEIVDTLLSILKYLNKEKTASEKHCGIGWSGTNK